MKQIYFFILNPSRWDNYLDYPLHYIILYVITLFEIIPIVQERIIKMSKRASLTERVLSFYK